MKLIKIGEDYYNFEYLISVKSNKNNCDLFFLGDKTASVSPEDWEQIKSKLKLDITEFENSYNPTEASF